MWTLFLFLVALVQPTQDDLAAATRTQYIVVRDEVAYVAQSGGMVLRDVEDPIRPRDLGWLPVPGAIHDILLDESIALLAAGTRGLIIADVSDPMEPFEIARLNTDGRTKRLARSGRWLYLADGMNGLLVVDLENLEEPRIVARSSTSGEVRALAVGDGLLAVAEAHGGLRVFSLERPDAPRDWRRMRTEGAVRDVCFVEERLYAALGNRGTAIFEPRQSTEIVRTIEAERSAQQLACAGGRLAISSLGSTVQLIDRDSSVQTMRVHRSAPIGRASFNGEQLWIAVDVAGMGLLRWEEESRAVERLLPRRRQFVIRDAD